jgi:hypothetical protein
MKGAWQSLEEQARKGAAEAGVTIISDIDRKPFEDATKPLRDELRADPKLGSLILYPCGNAGMPRSMAFFHVPAPTTCGETCAR